jgi:uncharacterized protein (UPF0264 family)
MTEGRRTSKLLVSVRSLAEAHEAVAGGADIVDVKDPAKGSLGMANPEVIASIAHHPAFAGRPVSAALGEWNDGPIVDRVRSVSGVEFLKIGTSQRAGGGASRREWAALAGSVRAMGSSLVAAAYADYQRAGAPHPFEVLDWSVEADAPILLVDTFVKDGRGFWDWISWGEYEELCRRSQSAGLQLAVAGSLDEAGVRRLLDNPPAIVAVRGAACRDSRRDGGVERERVAALRCLCRSIPLPEAPSCIDPRPST